MKPRLAGILTPQTVSLTNWALASSGGTFTASSTIHGGVAASFIFNGVRHTNNAWGSAGGWAGNTQVENVVRDFETPRTISKISVFTIADAINYNTNPTLTDTFVMYGITDYTVQVWNGSTWDTVGTATANDKVWRDFTFTPVATTKVKLDITAALADYIRVVEFEAWG